MSAKHKDHGIDTNIIPDAVDRILDVVRYYCNKKIKTQKRILHSVKYMNKEFCGPTNSQQFFLDMYDMMAFPHL